MSEIKFERLKLLFEYTKFHIGLYSTLITALIALMSFGGKLVPDSLHVPLKVVAVMVLLAGTCGGIVASSIAKFDSIDSFREERVGFWGLKMFPGRVWATLEHTCFWIGIGYAVLAVVFSYLLKNCLPKRSTPISLREWNLVGTIDAYASHSENLARLKFVLDQLALYYGRCKMNGLLISNATSAERCLRGDSRRRCRLERRWAAKST